jgi:hypothetical protein
MVVEIFKEFKSEVQENNGTKIVTYSHPTFPHFSGTCEYEEKILSGVNKPIRQRIMILVNCEMGDVIEFIHKKSPLSSEDLMLINRLIRDHSYEMVTSN